MLHALEKGPCRGEGFRIFLPLRSCTHKLVNVHLVCRVDEHISEGYNDYSSFLFFTKLKYFLYKYKHAAAIGKVSKARVTWGPSDNKNATTIVTNKARVAGGGFSCAASSASFPPLSTASQHPIHLERMRVARA